jgi:hypothetical protein
VTDFNALISELGAKQLALLHGLVPSTATIGFPMEAYVATSFAPLFFRLGAAVRAANPLGRPSPIVLTGA